MQLIMQRLLKNSKSLSQFDKTFLKYMIKTRLLFILAYTISLYAMDMRILTVRPPLLKKKSDTPAQSGGLMGGIASKAIAFN
jgi:hypothetical protein